MRPAVLEENVRRLLRRSYVPALPAPGFRDRLEGLVCAEVERKAQVRGGALERAGPGARLEPGSPWAALERGAPARWVIALAAAAVVAVGAWRYFAAEVAPTRERLVARGEVALGRPDGSWCAASAEERVHGLHVGALPLTAVTPAGLEFELLVAQGRVHLEERTELVLARAGEDTTATLVAGAAVFLRGDERLTLLPARATVLAVPASASSEPLAVLPAESVREERTAEPTPPAVAARVARSFSGRVSADGLPVTAFTVALLPERRSYEARPPLRREFTSADGSFAWPDPPEGKQRVFVHAAGFALCALGEHDFSAAPPELSAGLAPGATVRGSVLDREGNPVAGALVIAEDEAPTDGLLFTHSEHYYWLPVRAETQADGRFELAHVAPGVHTLRIEAEGFATAWVDGVGVDAALHEELVVTLQRGGAVEGRVERDDGGPWAEAEVVAVAMDQVQRERQSVALTHTDAEGHYRFEHLPPVTMLVVMMRTETRPDVRPVQIETAATARVDFLAPRLGIRLHGRLLQPDGQPCPLRNLGLFDLETASWSQDWVASTTDADGTYTFEGVQPGRYSLYLVDPAGRGLRCVGELSLPAGPTEVEHDLSIPAGRLDVVVRAAEDGAPVDQASLLVMRLEDDGRETFAAFDLLSGQGLARLTQLRPGRYYVLVYPTVPGLGYARSEALDVTEERASTLELWLEAGGAAVIVVHAADGRALEGASVTFHDEGGGEHQFSRVPLTDAAGRYRALGLVPGRYRVRVELEGHAPASVDFDFHLGHEPEIPVVLTLAPR